MGRLLKLKTGLAQNGGSKVINLDVYTSSWKLACLPDPAAIAQAQKVDRRLTAYIINFVFIFRFIVFAVSFTSQDRNTPQSDHLNLDFDEL